MRDVSMRACMLLGILLGSLLSLASAVAAAQPSRDRSLDVSVGAGGLLGGEPRAYRSTTGAAADVMFSAPVGERFRLGISWSGQLALGNTDDCIPRDPGSVTSRCRARLPLVSSWSALVGSDWQLAPRMAVRISAGPSLVSVYQKTSTPYYWSTMGGVSGRVDFIVPGRPNFLVSMRSSIVPALPGASGTFALGLGIGLH